MAENTKGENDKLVQIAPKFETKSMNDLQKARTSQLQQSIQGMVNIRDNYITGVADGMGLEAEWKFDFDSFFNKGICNFVKPVKAEVK